MQVQTILHEHISVPLGKARIRETKRKALIEMTSSLLNHSRLTLTSLGRHMPGKAFVKHKIKRVDRWLNNDSLYDQSFEIYKTIFSSLLTERKELSILVDWSGCCNWSECVLRASLLYDGRSITIYQEVHSTKVQQKPEVHSKFLKNLSTLIPKDCKVTLITDRGFQASWFRAVQALGWDFIGRVSKSHHFKLEGGNRWKPLNKLYASATHKAYYLGAGEIGKSKPLKVFFHSFRGKAKGRKYTKPRSKPYYAHIQKMYKTLHHTPWVLVTSLSPKNQTSKKIVKAYQGRMQIEQNFRDDKNERWGFGLQYNRSRSQKRITILLLLAAIASYILMLIGITAEKMKLHKRFQANTSKRRVLSFLFLAKQVIMQFKDSFCLKDINQTYQSIARGAS